MPRDSYRFAAEGAAVGRARRQVRATLAGWGLEDVGDDAALVVSELFSNAIRHTASDHVDISLWAAGQLIYIEVADQGGGVTDPMVRAAKADDEGGRGLLLVGELTDRWGVRPHASGRGRAVWAAMPFAARSR